jgi:hypothetical protein
MRLSWRRRRKFNLAINYFLSILLLLLNTFDLTTARSFVGPARRLQCMTCRTVNGDTTQLDQFRVRQNLQEPWCDMEAVECAPQQVINFDLMTTLKLGYLCDRFDASRSSFLLDWLWLRSKSELRHSSRS